MDKVKINEEIVGQKTKQPAYIIRTINSSGSKILVIIKVIKMILLIMLIIMIITTTIITTTMIKIKLIIKCRGRSRASTTNNSMLFVATLYDIRKPLTNITKICISDVMWVIYAALEQFIHHLTG